MADEADREHDGTWQTVVRAAMKLVASLIVQPDIELARYLRPVVESLDAFCDEIRLWHDGGSPGALEEVRRLPVSVQGTSKSSFFEHEGAARQAALEWAMEANPTHILAIDADEIVTDGEALRAALAAGAQTAGLCMQEVWQAEDAALAIRMDGGWNPHPIPCVFAPNPRWRIPSQAHASGRVPAECVRGWNRRDCVTEILHLGWANQAERAARWARYAGRGGFGHASKHIDSIMWKDARVRLCWQDWPATVSAFVQEAIVARAGRVPPPGEEPGF